MYILAQWNLLPVSVNKNTRVARALALQSGSRTCSLAPALVL